ncbi:hypothetical protein F383_34775 [Gossypium arboreum]|uniref:Uncharacterized protein n=1 Tax=Gossypium arboreum TaxID=29729 RepID=A0A0B0NB45_GOSAR|nr:hypothetical protein F383_34775 [Gossypium arboreum]
MSMLTNGRIVVMFICMQLTKLYAYSLFFPFSYSAP